MTMSYTELSGKDARDILGGGTASQLLTDSCGDVQVPPLSLHAPTHRQPFTLTLTLMQVVPSVEVPVTSPRGLLALIEYCTRLRATEATGVHDASSRSHAICRVYVQRAQHPQGRSGCLTLVDLAGSEQRIDSEKHTR